MKPNFKLISMSSLLILGLVGCGGGGSVGTTGSSQPYLDSTYGLTSSPRISVNGDLVYNNRGRELLLTATGEHYIAGWTETNAVDGNSNMSFTKFNSDGGYNPGFFPYMDYAGGNEKSFGVAMSKRGDLIFAGDRQDTSTSTITNMALGKMATTGDAVTAFGGTTGYTTDILGFGNSHGKDVAIQWNSADITGALDTYILAGDGACDMCYGIIVASYTSGGLLNTGFGTSGTFRDTTNGSYANEVKIAYATKREIYVAGTVQRSGHKNFYIIRLLQNGVLDTSFGNGGIFEHDVNGAGMEDIVHDITLLDDGSLIASGESGGNVALFRVDNFGNLVSTYGGGANGGVVLHTPSNYIATEFYVSRGRALELQTDGKIVVGGDTRQDGFPVTTRAWVLRFNSDGTLDTTFAADGEGYTLDGWHTEGFDVAIQPDGKILLGGSTYFPNDRDGDDWDFMVSRFLP
ncbi:MAG: hypothetical protein OEY09_03110 [Gammaproteobacteria bacterium]|nr:hypothetical protein [Gammaproteobacteria bacterium]